MAGDDVPVLIVGGSLVGLSTAVFLGRLGVPSLVLERHRGTAIHPRAALVNQRAIETYRAAGSRRRSRRPPRRSSSRTARSSLSRASAARSSTGTSASSTKGSRTSARCRGSSSRRSGSSRCCSAPRSNSARGSNTRRRRRRSSRTTTVSPRSSARATAVRSGPSTRSTSSQPTAAHSPIREQLGIREPRPRQLLGQHHDLLPRRCAAADGRPQPQRDLRLRPAPAGVLPLLDRPPGWVSRRQLDDRRRPDDVGADRRGHERADVHRVRA